jgi:hypothetical protein
MSKKYYLTPLGSAVYPRLTEPDEKYNKFSCNLLVSDSTELQTLFSVIKELVSKIKEDTENTLKEKIDNAKTGAEKKRHTDALNKLGVNLPYMANVDDEGQDVEGEWILKSSCPAEGKNRKGEVYQNKVAVFDSKKLPFPKSIQIWGGSKVILQVEPRAYYIPATSKYGVSLRLRAAQIIELVSGGSTGDSFGFSEQEGFVAPKEEVVVEPEDKKEETILGDF